MDAVQKRLLTAPPLGARVQFDFGDDGKLFLDGRGPAPVVTLGDGGEAETGLKCSLATFQDILSGALDPTMAYMMGKLKIQGSMGYALKLSNMLED